MAVTENLVGIWSDVGPYVIVTPEGYLKLIGAAGNGNPIRVRSAVLPVGWFGDLGHSWDEKIAGHYDGGAGPVSPGLGNAVVKYHLSVDGGQTWIYWDGVSNWLTSADPVLGDYADANIAADFETPTADAALKALENHRGTLQFQIWLEAVSGDYPIFQSVGFTVDGAIPFLGQEYPTTGPFNEAEVVKKSVADSGKRRARRTQSGHLRQWALTHRGLDLEERVDYEAFYQAYQTDKQFKFTDPATGITYETWFESGPVFSPLLGAAPWFGASSVLTQVEA